VPSVVKVHGSDLNLVAKVRSVRAQLAHLMPRATRLVAVSRPLKNELVTLGADAEKVAIVGNGVDHAVFHPRGRELSRRALGLSPEGKLIVYVGRIVREKGLFELIEAMARVPDGVSLALVGDGAARAECERAAESIGVRVRFAGARPLEEIPLWLGAADVFALPSWNEGTPNVLLEAFACGRRVVVTDVGGIPDLMTDAALGEMVPVKDANALAAALTRQAFADDAPQRVAALTARGGWDESARKLHQVLCDALACPR
jgi:glycosyltransferase involved in cell wall biosynthesis